jgi:uncharacterized membrane protein
MKVYFKQVKFEGGIVYGIQQIGALLAWHYPAQGKKINELSNAPIII